MKKVFISAFIITLCSNLEANANLACRNAKTVRTSDNKSVLFAKRIPVNERIKSTDGTEWTLVGWIEIETQWGWPPVAIVAYELTLSNGKDSWTFKSTASVDGNTGEIIEVISGDFPRVEEIDEIMTELNKRIVLPNM